MKLIHSEKTQWNGITENWYLRPDGKITIQRVQDADPIFGANEAQRTSQGMKAAKNYGEGLGTKVASIPMGLVEQYLKETGIDLQTCPIKELHAFLNNPQYAKVRTAWGMV